MTTQDRGSDRPDLSTYERLIDEGIAAANRRGSSVDHVTARRLAIWLASQPQQTDFARGLTRFARTGVITHALKAQLRNHARSAACPFQSKAARLMQYTVARGVDLGPIGPNFGSTCDQIDRADMMLAGLRERVRHDRSAPEQAWPDIDGPQVVAAARRDAESRTVSIILDGTTANITVFAIAAYASDREAHVREIEQFGESLPEGSYGRRNRQVISARERRIAARLRAVERAYRLALERDAVVTAESAMTLNSPERAANLERELE
jgi:hypothetical protein